MKVAVIPLFATFVFVFFSSFVGLVDNGLKDLSTKYTKEEKQSQKSLIGCPEFEMSTPPRQGIRKYLV